MVLTKVHTPQLKTVWINDQFYYQQGSSTLLHPVDRILKAIQDDAALTRWRNNIAISFNLTGKVPFLIPPM